MSAPRVFVSHSGADAEFASWVSEQLRRFGADVWLDSSHMGSGDFVAHLNAVLQSRDVVLLVLSPMAIQSIWVQQEFNAAVARANSGVLRAPIVIMARPCQPKQIPPLWNVYHRYDATRDPVGALKGVAREMGLTIPPDAQIPLPPQSSLRPKKMRAAASSDLGAQPPPDWTLEILKPLGRALRMQYPGIALVGIVGSILEGIIAIYLIQTRGAVLWSPNPPGWLGLAIIAALILPWVGFVTTLIEMRRRRRNRLFVAILLLNLFTLGGLGAITAIIYGFWGSRQMRPGA